MNIKDERELANVLGMAFAKYANIVENGGVYPFEPFISGASTVTVNVTLNANGSITVSKYVAPVAESPPEAETPLPEVTVVDSVRAEPSPEMPEETPIIDQKELENNKVVVTTRRKRKT